MDQVRGRLPKKQSGQIQELQSQLQQMGYEFSEEMEGISFSRPGRLESVLSEVLPLVEKGGWNARQELYLEETHPEKASRSIYENGRILRLYPSH
jgi:hypothetical protein